eukprot:scaffold294808_cov43-Prasinocladus_malaysianus.AAC.1
MLNDSQLLQALQHRLALEVIVFTKKFGSSAPLCGPAQAHTSTWFVLNNELVRVPICTHAVASPTSTVAVRRARHGIVAVEKKIRASDCRGGYDTSFFTGCQSGGSSARA